MRDGTFQRVRASDEAVRTLLDQLDQAEFVGKNRARSAERFAYRRHSARIDLRQIDGTCLSHVCHTRNLSTGGAAMLIGQFVYAGTRVRLHLVTLQNQTHIVEGTVRNCRYITGTGSIHEIGLQFDGALDVSMFNREAQRISVVLLCADQAQSRLAAQLFTSLKLACRIAPDLQETLAMSHNNRRDVLLIDLGLPGFDPAATVATARRSGDARPFVGMVADAAQADQAITAGFNWFVERPLNMMGIKAAMHEVSDDPLFSSAVHDAGMKDFIDSFVSELPLRVTELESAFISGDDAAMTAVARMLLDEGAAFGFDAISVAAAAVKDALAIGKSGRELRRVLNRLTRVCLAARPASLELVNESHATGPVGEA